MSDFVARPVRGLLSKTFIEADQVVDPVIIATGIAGAALLSLCCFYVEGCWLREVR